MNILKHATYSNNDYQILSQERLFSGFLKVERMTVQHRTFQPQHTTTPPEDVVIHRELLHRPHAAGALLYNDQQQRFALIEQFRVGAIRDEHSPWQLEIVAGVLDGDESPETCIRRECVEESGCEVEHLTHLFTFYPSAGACSELFDLYAVHAQLPEHGGQVLGMADEGENILLHIFDYQDVPALLTSGRLRNAPVIMAIQWLAQHIQQLQATPMTSVK